MGDNYSSKLFKFKNGKLTQLRATSLLNSLGYFYGSITKLLGFTYIVKKEKFWD